MKKFISCESNFEESDIVLFGVPFDATSTYRKGSRLAPAAIRKESDGIETYSPYQDKDLEDIKVHDAGDIDLSLRGTKQSSADITRMLEKTEEQVKKILIANKIPVMLGGEHLVTLGAFRAVAKKHPDICLIHFDAHTDLREHWEGNPYNHSTVIRRCHDVIARDEAIQTRIPDPRIFQFGIRSGERVEFEWARTNTVLTKHNFDGIEKTLKAIGNRPVYFTVDLDVLDPGEFGGTGTPEAGGVSFLQLLDATKKVFDLNVVGCDITELSPPFDTDGKSIALACKFLREVLLMIK